MSNFKFQISHGEEQIHFFIDWDPVGSANHDEDGYAGMVTAEALFKNIAEYFGETVEEIDHTYT